MSLIKIVREAIINNCVRHYSFNEIAERVGCTRDVAKQLYFAFLYQASEEHLKSFVNAGGYHAGK